MLKADLMHWDKYKEFSLRSKETCLKSGYFSEGLPFSSTEYPKKEKTFRFDEPMTFVLPGEFFLND